MADARPAVGAGAATGARGYDLVGEYDQDAINGFDDSLVRRLIGCLGIRDGLRILDAMAGDGNLSARITERCDELGVTPGRHVLLEASSGQCLRAEARFAGQNPRRRPEVVRGDVVTMTAAGGEPLPDASFDVVVIKSGTHEIPAASQQALYRSIRRVLAPGGKFVNLGFAFDDPEERDEFREVTRVKDSLAGLDELVRNRHFPLRGEFYSMLLAAGFAEIAPAETLVYTIDSAVAAAAYFNGDDAKHVALQAAQVAARTLRDHGRIVFGPRSTVSRCPAELTVAVVPERFTAGDTYDTYPYLVLRNIKAYRELLDAAAAVVRPGESVLDLGCGPGLLGERLVGVAGSYVGVDRSERLLGLVPSLPPGFIFRHDDLNGWSARGETFAVVCLLNVVYQGGLDARSVIARAWEAVGPGGRLVVSGPKNSKSFDVIEPLIMRDLGPGAETNPGTAALVAANRALLAGADAFLDGAGFDRWVPPDVASCLESTRDDLYYGEATFHVFRRGV